MEYLAAFALIGFGYWLTVRTVKKRLDDYFLHGKNLAILVLKELFFGLSGLGIFMFGFGIAILLIKMR